MSARKRFDLHQVLSYRAEIEREKKQEFVSAKHELEAAENLLEQEKNNREKLSEEFGLRQQQIDSIFEMRLYADFFHRKREEIKEQQQAIVKLDMILESRREELLLATKEKKVMEQLKIKQNTAFRKEVAYLENLLLDEIAIQKNVQER